MRGVIAVRRETKSPWERRTPLTPEMVRSLVKNSGVKVLVQPSARRVFHDKEFIRAGAEASENLEDANVVFGVKEVPTTHFLPQKAYVFFSHVIKGQSYNMPMLQRILDLGCTLIDYEKVRDDNDNRLIFFGRFAGLAGMIDSLWALGQRLRDEGVSSPFATLEPAHRYDSLADAKAAIRDAGEIIRTQGLAPGLSPLVVGVAGYGNVAKGALEILAELPHKHLTPEELAVAATANTHSHRVLVTTFKEQHIVGNGQSEAFDLQHYYQHPEGYRSCFAQYLPQLTVLMNCNYWDERYPRLVNKAGLKALFGDSLPPRLKVIGDLGCDIEGAVECTLKCTEPGDPVYVWDPRTDTVSSGVSGHGPVILAVDILPSELPREASEEFTGALKPFVTALANADFTRSFAELELPSEIKRAVIAHRGQLTPDFEYISQYLGGA